MMDILFTPLYRQIVSRHEQRASRHKQLQLPGLRYRFIPAHDNTGTLHF